MTPPFAANPSPAVLEQDASFNRRLTTRRTTFVAFVFLVSLGVATAVGAAALFPSPWLLETFAGHPETHPRGY